MKKAIQALLQRILGFDNYLFVFSLFKIKTLRWDGKNKEGDFNFFLGMLHSSDVVLDIGANIGIMTALMAARCKYVYAFEPVGANLRALNRVVNFLKLKNVESHQVALGAEEGEVEIKMPVLEGVKMQGLSYVGHDSIEGYKAEHLVFKVRQTSLDQWPFDSEVRIRAIKMDVENYEQFVLKGSMSLIRKHKPVIYMELWDNENRRNCLKMLTEAGYQVRVLEKDQLITFSPGIHQHHNFFLIPESEVV